MNVLQGSYEARGTRNIWGRLLGSGSWAGSNQLARLLPYTLPTPLAGRLKRTSENIARFTAYTAYKDPTRISLPFVAWTNPWR